jgi:hypothetical protein
MIHNPKMLPKGTVPFGIIFKMLPLGTVPFGMIFIGTKQDGSAWSYKKLNTFKKIPKILPNGTVPFGSIFNICCGGKADESYSQAPRADYQ